MTEPHRRKEDTIEHKLRRWAVVVAAVCTLGSAVVYAGKIVFVSKDEAEKCNAELRDADKQLGIKYQAQREDVLIIKVKLENIEGMVKEIRAVVKDRR